MRPRRQKGFSLLELLAALTLFALVAAAMGSLSASSFRSAAQNRHATAAATLAQWEIEDLRATAYDSVRGRTRVETVDGLDFTITTAVADNTPSPGLKSVAVKVAWTGPEGTHAYDAETIFARLD